MLRQNETLDNGDRHKKRKNSYKVHTKNELYNCIVRYY